MEKEFKTITVRNLDEKPELVQALNEIMQERGLKTAQAVIEYIIAQHQPLTKDLKDCRTKRREETDQYYKWRTTADEEIATLKKQLNIIRQAWVIIEAVEP
jgi:aryl-alcohol dehydrogenase-like predicted oxidoreductase